jgi:hypothetical protein
VNAFTFRATDPDGDDLYYNIDWNNDSVVDERVPGSGYVASGNPVMTSYTWSLIGTYTFAVQAIDDNNNASGFSSHTITIQAIPVAPPVPPLVVLTTDRDLVRSGEVVNVLLRITANYNMTCTIYGVAGGTQTLLHTASASQVSYPYLTNPLLAGQLVRAVCLPNVPGFPLPQEEREERIEVIPAIEEV